MTKVVALGLSVVAIGKLDDKAACVTEEEGHYDGKGIGITEKDLNLHQNDIKNISCISGACLFFEISAYSFRNESNLQSRTTRQILTDQQRGWGMLGAGVLGLAGMISGGPPLAVAGMSAGYAIGVGYGSGRKKRELNYECTLVGLAFVTTDKDCNTGLTFDEIGADLNVTSESHANRLAVIDKNNDHILQPEEIHPCLSAEKIVEIRKSRKNKKDEQYARSHAPQLYFIRYIN